MKKYNLLNLLFGIFIFAHCTKNVELKGLEEIEPKLVVNAFFSTNQPWEIMLTQTNALTDSLRFTSIEQPHIHILENEIPLSIDFQRVTTSEQSLNIDKYVANSTVFPQENAIYTLEIETDGLAAIQAKDTMPVMPNVTAIDFLAIDIEDIPNTSFPRKIVNGQLNIQLQDIPNISNFYQIKLYYLRDSYRTTFGQDIDTLFEERLSYNFEDLGYTTYQNLLQDAFFDGENKTLRLDVSGLVFVDEIPFDKIFVEVRSLSYSYYNYYIQLEAHQNALSDPFSEPISAFSNIENGYGIWAARAVFRDTIHF